MFLVQPLTAPVTPVEALRRIAFLLERSRAGTYRVELTMTGGSVTRSQVVEVEVKRTGRVRAVR